MLNLKLLCIHIFRKKVLNVSLFPLTSIFSFCGKKTTTNVSSNSTRTEHLIAWQGNSFAVTRGDGAKIVRDAFVLAKEKAPVVLGHPA